MRKPSSGQNSFTRFGIKPHYIRVSSTRRGGIRL